jgi:hypothetical protein
VADPIQVIPEVTSYENGILKGKVAPPNLEVYPYVDVDIYLADPAQDALGVVMPGTYLATRGEGVTGEDLNPVTGEFEFNLSSLNIPGGQKICVAALYRKENEVTTAADPAPADPGLAITGPVSNAISTGTSTGIGAITATLDGTDLDLAWTGGTPPYLVQGKLELDEANWIDLQTVNTTSTSIPLAAPGGVFRVADGATKTVKLFKALLNGANERPTPNDQPGTGIGLLALDGLNATYVVSYQNLSTTPHLHHLHGLGTAEEAVGVKFNLVPAGTLGTNGLFVGVSPVDQATADGITNSLTYFNIHTPGAFQAGEIRGQVEPVP